MKDQIINFETSKLLYTKDFKELVDGCYQNFESDGEKKIGDFLPLYNINNQFGELLSAPTQSLLQKWLREIHNLNIEIFLSDSSPYNVYYYRVMQIGKYFSLSYTDNVSNTYEEALEKGLMEGLKLIKI